ncbi:hypothetical protein BN174_4310005 [Clostridioides difficile E15]|nr:hypothetical protein BN174_4310005 [Clostridioides difficile E15]
MPDTTIPKMAACCFKDGFLTESMKPSGSRILIRTPAAITHRTITIEERRIYEILQKL